MKLLKRLGRTPSSKNCRDDASCAASSVASSPASECASIGNEFGTTPPRQKQMNMLLRHLRPGRKSMIELRHPESAYPLTVSTVASNEGPWSSPVLVTPSLDISTSLSLTQSTPSTPDSVQSPSTDESPVAMTTAPLLPTTSVSTAPLQSSFLHPLPVTPLVEEENNPVVRRVAALALSLHGNGGSVHLHGPHHPDCVTMLNVDEYTQVTKAVMALDQAGNKLFSMGKYEQAFLRYERALILKRKTLLREDEEKKNDVMAYDDKIKPVPDTEDADTEYRAQLMASVATSINNVTYLKQRSGRASHEETMASYLKALQMKRQILGPDHLSVGKTLNNIGSVFYLKKEYEPALQAYSDALRIMQDKLGADDVDIGTVLSNIGDVYFAMQQNEAALKHYRLALRIRWSCLGSNEPKVTRLMQQIALLETGQQPDGDECVSSDDDDNLEEDGQAAFKHLKNVRTSIHELQNEIQRDMQFFDLLERQMEIDMIKDKMRIFREMRYLYNGNDGNSNSYNNSNIKNAVSEEQDKEKDEIVSKSSQKTNLVGSNCIEKPHSSTSLIVSADHSTENATTGSTQGRPGIRRSSDSDASFMTTEDRQKALSTVRERLAQLRAKRQGTSSEESGTSKNMASFHGHSSYTASPKTSNSRKPSYMFPTIASVSKIVHSANVIVRANNEHQQSLRPSVPLPIEKQNLSNYCDSSKGGGEPASGINSLSKFCKVVHNG